MTTPHTTQKSRLAIQGGDPAVPAADTDEHLPDNLPSPSACRTPPIRSLLR
ncbi:MAG: hypothetical protein WD118_01660 [Phycisphaeraceae bacterium]